jgi:hypothetical protein
MAYSLITSSVISSNTTTVTFSGIPQTFKDLCLRTNARCTTSGSRDMKVFPNNDTTAANYWTTYGYTDGGGAPAGNQFNSIAGFWLGDSVVGSSFATNVFGNSELYIANYTSTSYPKSAYGSSTNSNTSTAIGRRTEYGFRWEGTAAISSLVITTDGDFVAGSSIYLYGIG